MRGGRAGRYGTDTEAWGTAAGNVALGHQILLFARLNADDRSFYFLGAATYVKHVGELPMAVAWRLHHPLHGDLFQAFAAAVA